MANTPLPPSNVAAATDTVTYNGQSAVVQVIREVAPPTGSDPKTVVEKSWGAGNVGAGTERITLATDDAAIAAVVTAVNALATILGIVDSAPAANTVNDRLRLVVAGLAGLLKVAGIYNAALPTLTEGQSAQIQLDINGVPYVNQGALSSLLDSITARLGGVASGGAKLSHTVCAATTNATVVKASAGQRYKVKVLNLNTSEARYVHFCNSASAPTPGTTTVVDTLAVPAAVSSSLPTVVADTQTLGVEFTTGISFYVTKNPLPADTTALTTASDTIVIVEWF
ncbi:hypothetical protein VT84_14130 [Gemmata sp. SH-PL17]|uniref:hypothetical protein n=1 Tax=Gemmata sp. SH-PL17 TaxID=1630693 RepID=UPI00078DB807|nr:hypothetical protein [Gemmata sp. SH-PL17]AMV25532.1 hypothetical protein VT84_14130 [Gemmata sp. SH-PL17]